MRTQIDVGGQVTDRGRWIEFKDGKYRFAAPWFISSAAAEFSEHRSTRRLGQSFGQRIFLRSSDPENVNRHRRRFGANHASSILGKADLRIRDLALSGLAAELPEDFADLRHSRRANRMTFREQPA